MRAVVEHDLPCVLLHHMKGRHLWSLAEVQRITQRGQQREPGVKHRAASPYSPKGGARRRLKLPALGMYLLCHCSAEVFVHHQCHDLWTLQHQHIILPFLNLYKYFPYRRTFCARTLI